MNSFEEKIAQRELRDDELLSEACFDIAGAVMGRRLNQAFRDKTYASKTVIERIMKYFHHKTPEIPEGIVDLNDQLDYVFQPVGIARRAVRLTPGWQKNAAGPILGARKSDGHPIALIPTPMGGYAYDDPDTQERIRITAKTAALVDEQAVVMYKPFPLHKIDMRDLMMFIGSVLDLSDLIRYLAALAAVTLVGLLLPMLNRMLFGTVIDSGNQQLLAAVISFMACLTISMGLMKMVQSLLLARLNTKIEMAVQAAGILRVLNMPVNFFSGYSSGELSKIVEYLNTLCSTITKSVMSTGFAGVFSLVYIGQIRQFAPVLVTPSIMITFATLIFSIAAVFVRMGYSRQEMELNAREKGMVHTMISGIQKIRLSGSEKRAFARWGELFSKEAKLRYDPPALLKIETVIATGIPMIGTILIYFSAVSAGVTLADYTAFNASFAYITAAFASLTSIASTIATIRPTLKLIRPLMNTEPEIAEDKNVLTSISGKIELNHISFRYTDEQPWVLDDVSLKVEPGQYIAIVGRTGCGKSTMMRLMLGFEKPQRGAVYYDNMDLEKIDKKSLRRKIGVVVQNSKLVWGDIFSNITIAAPWLRQDDAWAAAEIADIADDIRAMPMGMQTIIQEGSGGISGGQKQRIMIARAIVAKPKILFFDEATSALDNISQRKISDALDSMQCTRIVIAHRLSTIQQCDRIIVLDQGKIAEDGSYQELLEKNGLFAQLVAKQRLDISNEG